MVRLSRSSQQRGEQGAARCPPGGQGGQIVKREARPPGVKRACFHLLSQDRGDLQVGQFGDGQPLAVQLGQGQVSVRARHRPGRRPGRSLAEFAAAFAEGGRGADVGWWGRLPHRVIRCHAVLITQRSRVSNPAPAPGNAGQGPDCQTAIGLLDRSLAGSDLGVRSRSAARCVRGHEKVALAHFPESGPEPP